MGDVAGMTLRCGGDEDVLSAEITEVCENLHLKTWHGVNSRWMWSAAIGPRFWAQSVPRAQSIADPRRCLRARSGGSLHHRTQAPPRAILTISQVPTSYVLCFSVYYMRLFMQKYFFIVPNYIIILESAMIWSHAMVSRVMTRK